MNLHRFRANGYDNYLRAISKESSQYIRSHDRDFVTLLDVGDLECILVRLLEKYPEAVNEFRKQINWKYEDNY